MAMSGLWQKFAHKIFSPSEEGNTAAPNGNKKEEKPEASIKGSEKEAQASSPDSTSTSPPTPPSLSHSSSSPPPSYDINNDSRADKSDSTTSSSSSSDQPAPPAPGSPPKKLKRSTSKSIGRHSGISEKTIRQLKEKYQSETGRVPSESSLSLPASSPPPSPSSDSSDSSSSSSSSPSPPSPRRPKKKKSSPRSSRRHSSLRKAVLMQEEVKLVMNMDDVRVLDDEGNTLLHRVALLGNYEALSSLCKRAPDIVNRLNNSGMSALHYAGNSNCVNVLIWWGAGIDTKSSAGKTPLYCAVERGAHDAVDALLQRRAKVNQRSKDEGWSALHVAALRGSVHVVELLLKWNADVNARTKRRQTPMHMCASMRGGPNGASTTNLSAGSAGSSLGRPTPESEDIARRLFARGVKLTPRDVNGATPLHLACGAGNAPLVAFILEKLLKKVPDAEYLVDNKGFTPYHYAAIGGYIDCIEILKRDLPVCELWTDDFLLSPSSWGLLKGHFTPEFFPSAMLPFCASFAPCVNEESTSDLIFLVEGRSVFAHTILCYASPFLAKMIDAVAAPSNDSGPVSDINRGSLSPHPSSKVTIEVKGVVSHKVFLEMLQFMYTGKISKESDWTQFWHAAVKFELLRLQQLCEKELGGTTTRDRSSSGNFSPLSSSPTNSSSLISSLSSSSGVGSASNTTSSDNNNTNTNNHNPATIGVINTDAPNVEGSDSNGVTTTSTTTTSPPLGVHVGGRRRTSTRKRNSISSRSRQGVDPQIDYYLELSLVLRRFVGNSLFHDTLLVCGEEYVHAHKLIIQNRSNFFFVLAKHVFSRTTSETIFHFDDITKGAMMGLMEFIYCGCFRSPMDPEDVWVMLNFVTKYSLNCPGLKEGASNLLYSVLSPDNVLELYSLNHYGFSILLASNNTDSGSQESPRESPRETSSPKRSPRDVTIENPQIEALKLQSIALHDMTNSTAPSDYPSLGYASGTSPRGKHRNSIIINDTSTPIKPAEATITTSSPHNPNTDITLLILKYASKKAVLNYITKYSKSPNIKLLQQDVKKYKNELNAVQNQKLVMKQKNLEIKSFVKTRAALVLDPNIRPRSDSTMKKN